MSDTPITDANEKSPFEHAQKCPPPLYMSVESSIVRELEIENNELRSKYRLNQEEAERLTKDNTYHGHYLIIGYIVGFLSGAFIAELIRIANLP